MKDKVSVAIDSFKNYKVLVIGDAILDSYIKGSTERICREAPVPVLNVQEKEHSCGGASNTAINIAALGAKVYFLTVTGKDESSKILLDVLKRKNILTEFIIRDSRRITLAKKRVTASSNILLRIDEGSTDLISQETEDCLIDAFKKLYKLVDAVVLSDYGYGVVTDKLIDAIQKLNAKKAKTLIVDSKDLFRFKKLSPTAVKPNYEETVRLLGLPKLQQTERVVQISSIGKKLLEITGAKSVAATIDSDGTILFEKGKKPFRIQAVPKDNRRAIGAGDTFISSMTLALCHGLTSNIAVKLASAAASIVLQKEGTVVCTGNELKEYFSENPKQLGTLDKLIEKTDELRKEGKRIVFTNGCFDILHKGHISLLNTARSFGDVLIIGINSDKSIKRLKGRERPINSLNDRLTVLAGLQSVDYLVPFEDDSPEKILKIIKPDVFVKGGDYSVDSIPESVLVHELGGTVEIVPFVSNKSTTNIIKKIKKGNKQVTLRS